MHSGQGCSTDKSLRGIFDTCRRAVIDQNDLESALKAIDEAIIKIENFKNSLLPLELGAASPKLNQQLQIYASVKDRIVRFTLICQKYAMLDPAPFKWRKNGLPTLGIFLLNKKNSKFQFLAKSYREYSIESSCNAPRFLSVFYEDVLRNIEETARLRCPCNASYTIQYFAFFNGIIPLEVRAKIAEAEVIFGKANVFLVKEVDQWYEKERVIVLPPPDPDPLVVGYDSEGGGFWLVTTFDVTPLERLIKEEFSININPQFLKQ